MLHIACLHYIRRPQAIQLRVSLTLTVVVAACLSTISPACNLATLPFPFQAYTGGTLGISP